MFRTVRFFNLNHIKSAFESWSDTMKTWDFIFIMLRFTAFWFTCTLSKYHFITNLKSQPSELINLWRKPHISKSYTFIHFICCTDDENVCSWKETEWNYILISHPYCYIVSPLLWQFTYGFSDIQEGENHFGLCTNKLDFLLLLYLSSSLKTT